MLLRGQQRAFQTRAGRSEHWCTLSPPTKTESGNLGRALSAVPEWYGDTHCPSHPPLGSSDLQVKLKVVRMVDGFRPGRIVRVKGPWTYVLLPWDEHINSEEAYQRSKKMILP